MTDAPAPMRERPLSPHLQVWRWHVTMLTSILHRASGVALYAGALILAGWALALASGPDAYGMYQGLLGSILGRIVLFGLTLATTYHLANGIRHLVWDTGRGLDIKVADASGVLVLVFTVAASVALWLFIWMAGGLY